MPSSDAPNPSGGHRQHRGSADESSFDCRAIKHRKPSRLEDLGLGRDWTDSYLVPRTSCSSSTVETPWKQTLASSIGELQRVRDSLRDAGIGQLAAASVRPGIELDNRATDPDAAQAKANQTMVSIERLFVRDLYDQGAKSLAAIAVGDSAKRGMTQAGAIGNEEAASSSASASAASFSMALAHLRELISPMQPSMASNKGPTAMTKLREIGTNSSTAAARGSNTRHARQVD